MRKFAPLSPDHPAVGLACDVCWRSLAAGDETTLIPVSRPALGEHRVDAAICHWRCVQEGQEETPFIICPVCGLLSYNSNDIEQRYCGYCHAFYADFREGV